MPWHAFDSGKSIGMLGSEDGRIIRDEAHTEGARITVERGGTIAPFSITCGIYGWMAHTRYFETESEAQSECEAMKPSLVEILSAIPTSSDSSADEKTAVVAQAIQEFVERFG